MRRLVPPLVVLLALLALAASASAAPRLYAPSYGSGPPETVSVFDVATGGALSPLGGSPFPLYANSSGVGGVVGIAFAPDGNRAASSFLFDGGVQGYSIDAGGVPTPAGAPVLTASATGIAVSPDGRFAYAPTREFMGVKQEGVRAFTIGADGALVPAGSFGSNESYEIAIGGGGRFLFTLGFTGIERFAIGADGGLTPLGTTAVSGVRYMVTSPDGRFLFLSIQNGDGGLVSYTVGADGSLTPNGAPLVLAGGDSEIPSVAPSGNRVYIPDEGIEEVVTAGVGADGALSLLSSFKIEDPRSAAVSPDGRFLFVYHAGPEPGIVTASLDANGIPTLLPSQVPFDTAESLPIVFRPGPAPVASFTAKAAAPRAAASFNAAKSANAATYDWDFGDGTTLANGGPKPTHAYAKAGKYTVTLSLTDAQGCGAKQVYTGQSTVCPGGTATTTTLAVDTLPVIGKLKAAPKKFLPAGVGKGKGGTKFRVKLNEKAKIQVKIEQRLPGRKVGRKCKKPTPGNAAKKKCSRFLVKGSRIKKNGKAGWNAIAFNGKLKGKPLAPGGYRITAVATDSAKGRSAPKTAGFQVLPY